MSVSWFKMADSCSKMADSCSKMADSCSKMADSYSKMMDTRPKMVDPCIKSIVYPFFERAENNLVLFMFSVPRWWILIPRWRICPVQLFWYISITSWNYNNSLWFCAKYLTATSKIIFYNYFTGKLREFYFTKGSQDQLCPQIIQSTARDDF